MALQPPKNFKPEFENLGIDKVRRELLARRWKPEKLSAARVWVENQDTQQWAAGQRDAAPREPKKSFRKWAVFIAAGFGLAYVAARVFG